MDQTAPTGGTFTINNNATGTNSTSVTLNTTCASDGAGVGGVQVAYGTGANPSNWTACSSSIPLTLPSGDGTKTVYMRFRDSLTNTTTTVTDTILLDQTAPTGGAFTINSNATGTNSTSVTLNTTCASDA